MNHRDGCDESLVKFRSTVVLVHMRGGVCTATTAAMIVVSGVKDSWVTGNIVWLP